MTQVFSESYIRAILDQAARQKSMSRDDFYRFFRGYITAGLRAEVDEASFRYFKRKRTLLSAKIGTRRGGTTEQAGRAPVASAFARG